MTAAVGTPEHGVAPFVWFGVAIVVGAAYALFMGLSYYNTPTFTESGLPTILGVSIAVVAFLIIGALAPAND
jgi:hypothetical protein